MRLDRAYVPRFPIAPFARFLSLACGFGAFVRQGLRVFIGAPFAPLFRHAATPSFNVRVKRLNDAYQIHAIRNAPIVAIRFQAK